MKREEMRRHIADLLKDYDIRHSRTQSGTAGAWTNAREVQNILPVKDEVSYATALHEIGHIRGRYQKSRFIVTRERWAWQWAKQQVSNWTPAMEKERRLRMAEYETLGPRATNVDWWKLHYGRGRGRA
jgi:hypothetical protein